MKNDAQMVLRRLTESDLSLRVRWMNDSRVYPSMGFKPPISYENTLKWYDAVRQSHSRYDVVVMDKDSSPIAFGGLTNIDYNSRKAEFYIFVNPDLQGQGYGKLATRIICHFGFQVLGLHKIFLLTNESNYAARALYEKAGFTLEGTHRHERISNDEFEDRLYFGLLRSEFDFSTSNLVMASEIPMGGVKYCYTTPYPARERRCA